MSTHSVDPLTQRRSGVQIGVPSHWAWLAGGFVLAFTLPFLLADMLDVHRDVFYGLYALAVLALFWLWSRSTGYDLVAATKRRWRWAAGLGIASAAVLSVMVVRTEEATARPEGLELVQAVLWRGLVYGVTDGLLLSVFPILLVFAALAGSRLNARLTGKVLIGVIALVASLAMTVVYHAGYSDFRSGKMTKPMTGDVLWSIPTLLTLNPLGAPIAHAGLHVSAVLHSYETHTFLPPHNSAVAPSSPAGLVDSQRVLDGLVSGTDRIAPGATAYVSGPTGTWVVSSGVANVDTAEGMRPDARMRLESVSKIWTAALVLRLAQDGSLSPDDTVEHWLPGLLPYGDRITVAQLLTHTSGLIDNNDMVARPGTYIARVGDPALRAQLTRVATRVRADGATVYSPLLWIKLAAWQPLRTAPGTTYHYSNIGFEILGLIAAIAGGRDLPSLYRDFIIDPLDLSSAAYEPQGPIAGSHPRAYRIAPPAGALTDTTDWHGGIGAEGGIVANAADTGRFLSALMQGKVLDPAWAARMKAGLFWIGPEPSGCGSAFGHSGGGAGFKTDVRVSADGDRVAVLLLNGRGGDEADDRAGSAIWRLYCAG
jgi:D-alanyl-D-alanine carboxypeptidase